MKLAILFLVASVSMSFSEGSDEENMLATIEKLSGVNLLRASKSILSLIKFPEELSPEKQEKLEKFIVKIAGEGALEKIKKFAKIGGPVAEAVVFALFFFEETQAEEFKRIEHRIDLVDQKLNEISDQVDFSSCENLHNQETFKIIPQISWLDNRLTMIATELKFESKFASLFNVYTDMSSAFNTFNTSILTYVENADLFKEKLKRFTDKYEEENYEFKLVDKATTSIAGVKSLVDTYKEVVMNYEVNSVGSTVKKQNVAPVSSSSSKLIFEFYLTIMLRVYEGFSMLKLCYQMQDNLDGRKSSDANLVN